MAKKKMTVSEFIYRSLKFGLRILLYLLKNIFIILTRGIGRLIKALK
jgi:hypothetical protein